MHCVKLQAVNKNICQLPSFCITIVNYLFVCCLHPLQKLEETCKRVESDESIAVMRRDSASAVHVPLRIREIVEECLSADKWERSLANASTLSTENSILMKELEKTKQLLVEYQKSSSSLSPAKNVSVSIPELW